MAADPASGRPAIPQANLDLNGRLIRVQAAAATMREAVERMSDRLRIRLDRAARNWAAIRGGTPLPLAALNGAIRACRHRACPISPARRGNAHSRDSAG